MLVAFGAARCARLTNASQGKWAWRREEHQLCANWLDGQKPRTLPTSTHLGGRGFHDAYPTITPCLAPQRAHLDCSLLVQIFVTIYALFLGRLSITSVVFPDLNLHWQFHYIHMCSRICYSTNSFVPLPLLKVIKLLACAITSITIPYRHVEAYLHPYLFIFLL